MILNKRQLEHEERAKKALATIRVGDKVRVVNCWEENLYGQQTFEVVSEPHQIGSTWSVKIEGKGWFDIACLEKVEV